MGSFRACDGSCLCCSSHVKRHCLSTADVDAAAAAARRALRGVDAACHVAAACDRGKHVWPLASPREIQPYRCLGSMAESTKASKRCSYWP